MASREWIAALGEWVDQFERPISLFQIMDGGNAWMIEGSENFGFALETAYPVRIPRKLIRQDLDRDFALQLRVSSAIHLAHPAFPEQCGDFVRAEVRAD